MDLYYDLGSNRLVRSPNDLSEVTSLTFYLDQGSDIRLRYLRNRVVVALAEGSTGKFGLKEQKKYDGDFIVSDLAWTKTVDGDDVYYLFEPDFTTPALYTLIGRNPPDTTNDKPSITLMGDIKWLENGKVGRTKVFNATIYNVVINDQEGMGPDPNPLWGSPEDYLKKADNLAGLASPVTARRNLGIAVEFRPELTGLTGGGATNLDGLVTAGGAWDGLLLFVRIAGALNAYMLDDGNDAEASPTIIRPNDYAAATNEKVWKLAL